jgi:hypothetical protein
MEINVQTERLVVVSHRRSAHLIAWCELCARNASLLTVDEAAAFVHTTARDIYRRVEAAELHFRETPEGALLICLNSLEGT